MTTILRRPYGILSNGTAVEEFILTEPISHMRLQVITYGGIITRLDVRSAPHEPMNIVLGYPTLEDYVQDTHYLGAIVGRYANRIRQASFVLGGKRVQLSRNQGMHQLHGGAEGFNRVMWTPTILSDASGDVLQLSHTSPHGHEGFPGNLHTIVTFRVLPHLVEVRMTATTDQITPVSLTLHPYFNLDGGGTVDRHQLKLASTTVLGTTDELLPDGSQQPVAGTVFDFREFRMLHEPVQTLASTAAGGLDHNWIVTDWNHQLKPVAWLQSERSGIAMEVQATTPGLQVYTGNFLGKPFAPHAGVCLEPQYFPDSPNHPEFPFAMLQPGEVYRETILYRFG